MMGCLTIESFKHIICQNITINCPVTVEDITIAKEIFGPGVAIMKDKTIRLKMSQVQSNVIEIPPEILEEHQDLTLCIDLMFVNGKPHFISIDQSIKY